MERSALEALARKDLQALAKARGVKANQKSGAIVEELLELARGAAFSFVDEEEDAPAPAAEAALRRSSVKARSPKEDAAAPPSRCASRVASKSKGESGTPAAAASRSTGKSSSSTPADAAPAAASPASRKRAVDRDGSPVAASSNKRRASRSATQQLLRQDVPCSAAPAPTSAVSGSALSEATPSRKRAAEREPEACVALNSPPPASAAKKRRLSAKEKENALSQATMGAGAGARTAAKIVPKSVSQNAAKSAIKARFDQAHERLFQTQRSISAAKTPSARLALQRKQPLTAAKALERAATLNDKLAATVPAFAPSALTAAGSALVDKKVSVAAKTTVASEAAKRAPAVIALAEPKVRPPRNKFNLEDSLKRPITWKMKSGKLV
jgi:hypothetical protein